MTISGQTNWLVPISRRVERIWCFTSGPISSVSEAFIIIYTKIRWIWIAPEAVVFDEAGTPEMVMKWTLGWRMTSTDVQASAFELHSITILAIKGIENMAAR